MNDIWYNKRIENCRFYKDWYSINSIFENCSFYGSQPLTIYSDYRNAAYMQTMYKNCTFINRDNTSSMILYSFWERCFETCFVNKVAISRNPSTITSPEISV